MSRKFHILTLGCQMNKNDSERIAGLLSAMGLGVAEKASEADIIIVNTCSVRQTAEERVYGLQENWKKYRKTKPHLITVVTGCMAGRDKDGVIRRRLKEVDFFFGIDELTKLPEWIAQKWGSEWMREKIENYLLIAPIRTNRFQTFITIQTGCDNYCTYCVVPYARGRERNRPVAEILAEIKNAVKNGAKEITLLGQVVNNYKAPDRENFSDDNPFVCQRDPLCVSPLKGGEQRDPLLLRRGEGEVSFDDFAALLWEINQIPGEFRIHFTAADPQYFSDAQIEALGLPKQVNYLHLPVQSGNNEILKKMNRKYTREHYLEIIRKIYAFKPNIALGTDIIVGFCSETDAQFMETVDLYHQCDFDISYHAMYSERSGTVSAKAFKDDVTAAIKKQRWETLQKLMEEIVLRKNQKYLKQTVRVLVERCSDEGICVGNSDELKMVEFPGTPDLVGKFVKVKINFAEKWVLRGLQV